MPPPMPPPTPPAPVPPLPPVPPPAIDPPVPLPPVPPPAFAPAPPPGPLPPVPAGTSKPPTHPLSGEARTSNRHTTKRSEGDCIDLPFNPGQWLDQSLHHRCASG